MLCSRLCEPSFFLITGKEQGLRIMRVAPCSGGLESGFTTAVWIGVPTDSLAYFGHNCLVLLSKAVRITTAHGFTFLTLEGFAVKVQARRETGE